MGSNSFAEFYKTHDGTTNKFAAIMPCYIINEEIRQLTQNAIDSLGEVDLYIIDNNSPMGGGWLRSIAHTYLRNNDNLGYAAAVNQGLALTYDHRVDHKMYEYTAVVSNDVRVSPNWKETVDNIFCSHTSDCPKGCTTFHGEKEGHRIYSIHFRMTDYGVPFKYGTKISYKGMERWCTAAFFVITWPKFLYFDNRFFNSFEDWDYFYRIRKLGFKTVYTDKSCFQHNHSFTQKVVGFKDTDKNRELFKTLHGEDPDILMQKMYPEQMSKDYYEGFNI